MQVQVQLEKGGAGAVSGAGCRLQVVGCRTQVQVDQGADAVSGGGGLRWVCTWRPPAPLLQQKPPVIQSRARSAQVR